ncbi:MAG TPA: AI-2E family transporter, partial [Alphaproteobacteria bacterium]|nr:AI-2E family transporter [Alphaproteobacteria bacterium]
MLTSQPDKRSRPKRVITEAQFDRMLAISSRLAMLMVGAVLMVVVLREAHAILAPVALAIVVGLVFGPVADQLESRGVAPGLSAAIVVLMFLALIVASVLLFAVPVAEWIGRIPSIWQRLQAEMLNWKEPLEAISNLRDQITNALGGGEAMEVQVREDGQVIDLALTAPMILGDILIFLASLYFYVATRENVRVAILSVLVTRRLRWRAAHVFNEVESKVSRFLLAVTLLNLGVGAVMTVVTFAFGLPSPPLWGAIAFVVNYIPYVGQAVMIATLLVVGLASQPDLLLVAGPIVCYMLVNLIEGQFLFPTFVGRTMTLNPFLIFFAIIFWIWLWGPVGSLMAVPSLQILQSVVTALL